MQPFTVHYSTMLEFSPHLCWPSYLSSHPDQGFYPLFPGGVFFFSLVAVDETSLVVHHQVSECLKCFGRVHQGGGS